MWQVMVINDQDRSWPAWPLPYGSGLHNVIILTLVLQGLTRRLEKRKMLATDMVSITQETVQNQIFTICGKQVMLEKSLFL